MWVVMIVFTYNRLVSSEVPENTRYISVSNVQKNTFTVRSVYDL